MRTRFRASDFGHIDFQAKTNLVRSNRSRRLVRNRILEIRVMSLLSQQLYVTSTTAVWRREEARRVHFARPQTRASEPALAAKTRAEALQVVFFSTEHPSPARCLNAADTVCVLSYYVYSLERRALLVF